MKNIFTITFSLFFLIGYSQATTQKIKFNYDNTGNQVLRYRCTNCIIQQPKDTLPLALGVDSVLIINVNGGTDAEGVPEITASSTIAEKNKTLQGTVSIYPNPTLGDLFIRLENIAEVESCTIEIKDINGKQVYFTKEPQALYSFSLGGLPAGPYFVSLAVNGKSGKYTVVKQ